MSDGDTFEALVTDLLECLIGWPTYSAWERRLHLLAATPAGVLDEAWAAAEKALPEGAWIALEGPMGPVADRQWMAAYRRSLGMATPAVNPPGMVHADTPAAALHALAAALGRSGSGGGRG